MCGEGTSGQQGHAFPGPSSLLCESVPTGARNPSPWRLAVLTHPLWPQQSKFCRLYFFIFFLIQLQARKLLVFPFSKEFGPRQILWAWWPLSSVLPMRTKSLGEGCKWDRSPLQLKQVRSHPVNASEASLLPRRRNISPPSMGLPFPAPSRGQECPPRTASPVNLDLVHARALFEPPSAWAAGR